MNVFPFVVVGAAAHQAELLYVLEQARPEAKVIIVFLVIFSIIAWSVMVYKAMQMRRAKKLNYYFNEEFRSQKAVLDMFDRKLQVEGCPLYMVYQTGCVELDARLRGPGGERLKQTVTIKNMEHVKRAIENVVAQESLKLESGLILLAIAVSGAPFIGLLGTVWGVMSTFAGIAQQGQATMAAMAPGVAAASSPPSPDCSWQSLPCSAIIGSCIICACSPSAWTISRRNWSQKWKRNILKRIDHATIFTTRSSGDVERDQHHAVARPRVRAAHHLHHHDTAAGTKHQPQAADGRPAGWKN
ncbi:MAG: MotA/TolQ/ExbB proton channel family protein [Limisphaerales bacterium]